MINLGTAPMSEWLRLLIFSTLNSSSSHRCGFEPSWGHVMLVGGQVVFLGDLPFSPHLAIVSAKNE